MKSYKWREVLSIVNGKNQKYVENPNGTYPIYGSGGIIGYATDFLCPENSIILGRKGSINKPIFVKEKFWNVDTAFGIIPNKNILLPLFLYYFCIFFNFEKLNTTVTIPSLTKSNLFDITINIPDLKIQTKITNILSKIDIIIYQKTVQLSKLDTLVKSRFVEMFGDPVKNPLGWNTSPFLSMGYCKNGMNFHTGDSGIKMHCLGVGDFKDYSIIDGTDHLPTISLKETPPEESMLQDGDILFVRSNGNKALVGRSLVVYPHNTPTTYSGFCIRYRLTSFDVNITYLLCVLKTDSIRKKMIGRGANIQNINQQTLATLDIPTPPIDLQEKFAAFVEQVDKSKLAVKQSLEKLETLKKSLMQDYFG
ncbi:restriction endonuclease subunit S [uncultured Mailhella sp.]|uniref:restriction endonuclease subunit S n=1 Tax=uncultured Mailhella sp. TaxID=1981031 RepID=UPI0032094E41